MNSKPVDRGKYKVLYNCGSNSNKQRKWLKKTLSKLRRLNDKDQMRNELENMEEEK